MIKKLKVFKCGHCQTRYVIMGTRTGSHLPVVVEEGKEYYETDEFDLSVHRSHLKDCPKKREEWELVKQKVKQDTAKMISQEAKER